MRDGNRNTTIVLNKDEVTVVRDCLLYGVKNFNNPFYTYRVRSLLNRLEEEEQKIERSFFLGIKLGEIMVLQSCHEIIERMTRGETR